MRVAGEDDAARSVEAPHHAGPALAEDGGELPVDPDLGVVVHDDLQDQGAPGRGDRADALGHGEGQAVPGEAHLPVAATGLERRRVHPLPAAVVEVGGARARLEVLGAHRSSGGPEIRTGRAVGAGDDVCLVEAPGGLQQIGAGPGAEIDDGVGPLKGRIARHLRVGEQRKETDQHRRRGDEQTEPGAHWTTPSPATFTAR
jgi:hypothetical protein